MKKEKSHLIQVLRYIVIIKWLLLLVLVSLGNNKRCPTNGAIVFLFVFPALLLLLLLPFLSRNKVRPQVCFCPAAPDL